jgi:hypothetical protein
MRRSEKVSLPTVPLAQSDQRALLPYTPVTKRRYVPYTPNNSDNTWCLTLEDFTSQAQTSILDTFFDLRMGLEYEAVHEKRTKTISLTTFLSRRRRTC